MAIDQPFKLGEAVKIGANEGVAEDIGLRSTKLRTPGKNLIIIPNKTVAAEAIINNSRFTGRRVEQVFGLTYDAKPDQLEALVAEMRSLINAEAEVNAADTHVYFRDLSTSSLDIWVVYVAKQPDFVRYMALRQRLNLAIMRAVEARGLSFAYPTTVMHLDGPIAKRWPAGNEVGRRVPSPPRRGTESAPYLNPASAGSASPRRSSPQRGRAGGARARGRSRQSRCP